MNQAAHRLGLNVEQVVAWRVAAAHLLAQSYFHVRSSKNFLCRFFDDPNYQAEQSHYCSAAAAAAVGANLPL